MKNIRFNRIILLILLSAMEIVALQKGEVAYFDDFDDSNNTIHIVEDEFNPPIAGDKMICFTDLPTNLTMHKDSNISTKESKQIEKHLPVIVDKNNTILDNHKNKSNTREITIVKVKRDKVKKKSKKIKKVLTKQKQKNTLEKKLKVKSKKVKNINTKKVLLTKDGLKLNEAVLIALKNSHKILSLREKVIQQKHKVSQKKGAFLPDVTLYADAGYAYTHTRSDSPAEDDYSTGDVILNITENIYSGGKHSAELKKEECILQSEKASFREKVEEETLKIIEAYINLYYQKQAIKIEEENINALNKILDIVKLKEKSGATSKGDLNNIKSKVENASTLIIKARSKYQNAVSFYQYFLKEEAKKEPIEGEFNFPKYSQNKLFDIMQNNNAKLQNNKFKIASQKYDYQAKKAPFRPNVDLIISSKEKFSRAEIDPYRDEKASAMLSMRYNLYKGGADKAKMLSSKSKITQLQYQYADILESTKYNLQQLYDSINSTDDSLIHIKNETLANKKTVDSYWQSFKYANQDIQALLLAQQALNRSLQDEIKEKKNYIMEHFKLLSQIGKLIEFIKVEDFVNP